MDATYCTKAIILTRQSFREQDSKSVVYSLDKGKLELVARGTKKISSKLAGHLEPISLSNLMIVNGRQFDYIGSAVSENCFSVIKNDLDKLQLAGQAINIFNQLIKAEQRDENVFKLLQSFLDILNQKDLLTEKQELLYNFFIFKLLIFLGYKPELYHCLICKKKILPNGSSFDLFRGGLVCKNCSKSKHSLVISENCIKVLRFVAIKDLTDLVNLKIDKRLNKEVCDIVSSFLQYSHQ